jgi:alkylhydroperoxidase family enzyme
LLDFAGKLTESPSTVGAGEFKKLRAAGWDEKAIWEITTLVSFFNFSGRIEAASGLPQDEIPTGAKFAEAKVT